MAAAARLCVLPRWTGVVIFLVTMIVTMLVRVPAATAAENEISAKSVEPVKATTGAIQAEWLPLSRGRLLPSPLADPLQVNFSVGVRAGDQVVNTSMIDASFGGVFPLLRTLNSTGVESCFSLEAGVWFIPWTLPAQDGSRAQEFFSSDFYVGLPISVRHGNWSTRLRVYHVSYHLGDEANVEHLVAVPRSKTLNAVEVFGFYQWHDDLRIYVGAAGIVRSTGHDSGGPLYLAAGVDYEFAAHRLGVAQMNGSLYAAGFLRTWPLSKERLNETYSLGYLARPHAASGRTVRAFVELNRGRSWVGRFSEQSVRTIGLRLAFDQ